MRKRKSSAKLLKFLMVHRILPTFSNIFNFCFCDARRSRIFFFTLKTGLFFKCALQKFHFNSIQYRDSILATDLVSFFGNRTKLDGVVKSGNFDWNNGEHRKMGKLNLKVHYPQNFRFNIDYILINVVVPSPTLEIALHQMKRIF